MVDTTAVYGCISDFEEFGCTVSCVALSQRLETVGCEGAHGATAFSRRSPERQTFGARYFALKQQVCRDIHRCVCTGR